MSNYWPWWAGAVGLALVTINYTVATDRSFGVSGAWDRVLHWRAERRAEKMEAEFTDEHALVEALAAATAEQFGNTPPEASAYPGTSAYPGASAYPGTSAYPGAGGYPPAPSDPRMGAPVAAQVAEPPAQERGQLSTMRPAPVISQLALLLSILLGGWIAAATSGRFKLRLDMGDGFREIVTNDPVKMIGVLFVGGVLVGFGTRLAGGCSSGHGLNGCGRLQPVSIVATAVFFGTAVLVSFLLWKVI